MRLTALNMWDGRRLSCAEYLLDQGADVFAVDKHQRRSAIHYAVAGRHIDVVKMLLSDNAKVHTEDGQVPLRDVRIHDMSGQCRCGAASCPCKASPACAHAWLVTMQQSLLAICGPSLCWPMILSHVIFGW